MNICYTGYKHRLQSKGNDVEFVYRARTMSHTLQMSLGMSKRTRMQS